MHLELATEFVPFLLFYIFIGEEDVEENLRGK